VARLSGCRAVRRGRSGVGPRFTSRARSRYGELTGMRAIVLRARGTYRGTEGPGLMLNETAETHPKPLQQCGIRSHRRAVRSGLGYESRSEPVMVAPRSASQGLGSTFSPAGVSTSKCRCGPVEIPRFPTVAISSPAATR
jgi:hypothetical protein